MQFVFVLYQKILLESLANAYPSKRPKRRKEIFWIYLDVNVNNMVESPSLEEFKERLDMELSVMLVFGHRLDLMVSEVFSSLSDSVILWYFIGFWCGLINNKTVSDLKMFRKRPMYLLSSPTL